jgi:hypothetical protein
VNPEEGEQAGQKNMKREIQVQGEGEGQNHEQPIGGIKKRRLESPKKGDSTAKVWIPKGQVAFLKFPETKLVPPNKDTAQIPVGEGQDFRSRGRQEVPKDRQGGG